MLAVGVIVIWSRNAEACPPPMYAMCEDPRRPQQVPHAWTKGAESGWEVRVPIGKENLEMASNYHRDPGYRVHCEFDTLVDPFYIPPALPPKDPDMVPADPAWTPEVDESFLGESLGETLPPEFDAPKRTKRK